MQSAEYRGARLRIQALYFGQLGKCTEHLFSPDGDLLLLRRKTLSHDYRFPPGFLDSVIALVQAGLDNDGKCRHKKDKEQQEKLPTDGPGSKQSRKEHDSHLP